MSGVAGLMERQWRQRQREAERLVRRWNCVRCSQCGSPFHQMKGDEPVSDGGSET